MKCVDLLHTPTAVCVEFVWCCDLYHWYYTLPSMLILSVRMLVCFVIPYVCLPYTFCLFLLSLLIDVHMYFLKLEKGCTNFYTFSSVYSLIVDREIFNPTMSA